MDSSEEAEALQQMRELLKARLPPEDFKRFKQADIRNLVINKRFEVSFPISSGRFFNLLSSSSVLATTRFNLCSLTSISWSAG